jgi:hypothetical protein
MAFPIAGPTTVVDQSLADDRAGSFYPGRKMAGSSASRELRFANLANDASARLDASQGFAGFAIIHWRAELCNGILIE